MTPTPAKRTAVDIGLDLYAAGFAAGERAGIERAAKVCDEQRDFWPAGDPEFRGHRAAAWGCAAAIRALPPSDV